MTNNTGGPAFPGLHPSKECRFNDPGMTLRDYFAANAMQGILASRNTPKSATNEEIARVSYYLADTMLKERDK
jgi:hypothetical protein